jgi:Zn-dependent M28 family amino/carboxypeptidase
MKVKSLLVALILLIGPTTGIRAEEKPDGDPLMNAFEKIRRAALTERNTFAMLKSLVKEAPHRLSGSVGAAKAVKWAERTMKEAGLENVRLDPVLVPHWERGEVEVLKVAGRGRGAGERFAILALGGSIATPEIGITAGVIEVKSFKELADRRAEADGKIVFFNRPMDPAILDPGRAYSQAVDQRVRGAIEASKAGGVAAIVRSITTRLDDAPHTGGMRYDKKVPPIPAAAVSTVGAERISALLASGKKLRLNLKLDCRKYMDQPSHNVIGELPGTSKPEEILVVGGHLDSWDVGEGAHDDGAGCCQSIEAVRLLKALGLVPKRTIRVVLFMNEENGLRGGKAYALDHAHEMKKHVLALESDRGGFTPRGFVTDANPDAFAVLRKFADRLEGWDAGALKKGGGGADISPMARHGVIQVGYLPDTQRYFDYHHAATDTIDKVNERELELGTAVMASLLYAVANAKETLPRNPVKKK